MGWERRGSQEYYYKKQREGSRVRSVYVGRGEIAHMVEDIQASSPLIERIAHTIKSTKEIRSERTDATLDQACDLIQLITQAALLTAGFHTHKRQWRKKRDVGSD